MVPTASYPPLQKAQERGTHSSRAAKGKAGPPARRSRVRFEIPPRALVSAKTSAESPLQFENCLVLVGQIVIASRYRRAGADDDAPVPIEVKRDLNSAPRSIVRSIEPVEPIELGRPVLQAARFLVSKQRQKLPHSLGARTSRQNTLRLIAHSPKLYSSCVDFEW